MKGIIICQSSLLTSRHMLCCQNNRYESWDDRVSILISDSKAQVSDGN